MGTVAGFSLSNYISAEEACDWTGKREAELRVSGRENDGGEEGESKVETDRMIQNHCGFK